jgi:hypothetical protein
MPEAAPCFGAVSAHDTILEPGAQYRVWVPRYTSFSSNNFYLEVSENSAVVDFQAVLIQRVGLGEYSNHCRMLQASSDNLLYLILPSHLYPATFGGRSENEVR